MEKITAIGCIDNKIKRTRLLQNCTKHFILTNLSIMIIAVVGGLIDGSVFLSSFERVLGDATMVLVAILTGAVMFEQLLPIISAVLMRKYTIAKLEKNETEAKNIFVLYLLTIFFLFLILIGAGFVRFAGREIVITDDTSLLGNGAVTQQATDLVVIFTCFIPLCSSLVNYVLTFLTFHPVEGENKIKEINELENKKDKILLKISKVQINSRCDSIKNDPEFDENTLFANKANELQSVKYQIIAKADAELVKKTGSADVLSAYAKP